MMWEIMAQALAEIIMLLFGVGLALFGLYHGLDWLDYRLRVEEVERAKPWQRRKLARDLGVDLRDVNKNATNVLTK